MIKKNLISMLNKDDEELCSLKKLIHEELKELIKSKSTIEATNATNTPSDSTSLADLSFHSKSATEEEPAKQKQKIKSSPREKEDADVCRLSHLISTKNLLKSTTQSFLHKHKPTVIYNSMLNHRNMPHTPPPPIPGTPRRTPPPMRKTLSASYANGSAVNCQHSNFKSHMKNSNLVFDSASSGNRSAEELIARSSSCSGDGAKIGLNQSDMDEFSRKFKESKNASMAKNNNMNCGSSEMLEMVSPHLIDEFSSNLIAARAFSTTSLNSPTFKTSNKHRCHSINPKNNSWLNS